MADVALTSTTLSGFVETDFDQLKQMLQTGGVEPTWMVIPRLASAPVSPVNGQLYYNTTSNKLFARVNAAWVELVPSNANPLPVETTGASLSGGSGTEGRILTLSNTRLTTRIEVVWERQVMQSGDITVTHNASNSTVTFNLPVSNSDRITYTPYYT